MDILPSIGQTELTAGYTGGRFDDDPKRKATSLGWLYPGCECAIKDKEGKHLEPNQVGEICIRAYQVMKGYYKMPEATAQVSDSEGNRTYFAV